MITGAGHHVFADKPELFNRYVNEACALSDNNAPLTNKSDADEQNDSQVDEDIENSSAEATNNLDKKNVVKTPT